MPHGLGVRILAVASRPPVNARTPQLRPSRTHAHLIQRIITNKPHHMPGWHLADALDFEDRAEHLRHTLELGLRAPTRKGAAK
jgi:hypothetical protein